MSRLAALPPTLTRRITDCVTETLGDNLLATAEFRNAIHETVTDYVTSLQASRENLSNAFNPNQKYQQEIMALFLGGLGFDTPQVLQQLVERAKGSRILGLKYDFLSDSQIYALKALSKLQAKEPFVIKALVAALQDNDWTVREKAAQELDKLQTKESFVIKALVKALKDDKWYVCIEAAKTLGELHVKDAFVIEALIKALKMTIFMFAKRLQRH